MLRLLVYLLLFGFSGSLLYALFTILLLPGKLRDKRELKLPKSREEVYYFLRNSQYFPLWQVFETGARATNKYNFNLTQKGITSSWKQVWIENSPSFSRVVVLEDRPLEFLKLRYFLKDSEYPLDLSISLADAMDSTQSIWSYELPIRASFWDLAFSSWSYAYQFYNLHQIFDAFIPKLTQSLSKLAISVPFSITYKEQKIEQALFWIYAEGSCPDTSSVGNFEQRQQIIASYLQNRPRFINDTNFYLQKEGNIIRIGQLFAINPETIDSYAEQFNSLGADLHINRLFVQKKYQVKSFAFTGSSASLLDSLHRHFPNTLIKSKNNLTLEQVYRGEDAQKHPLRARKSWIYLAKF